MLAALTNLVGQSYSYDYSTPSSSPNPVVWLIFAAVLVVMIASMWRMFTKAGKPGWAAIIPIYNTIVLLEIAGRPAWWVLLFLIPFVNLVISIIVYYDVAKAFGKDMGFAILLLLLPFIGFPILGFGSATYHAPQHQ